MERLTKRNPKNNEPSYIYRTDCGDANVEATEYDAIWKLAAYEDTGLTPEAINQMNDFINSQCAKLLEKNTDLQAENERLQATHQHIKSLLFYMPITSTGVGVIREKLLEILDRLEAQNEQN